MKSQRMNRREWLQNSAALALTAGGSLISAASIAGCKSSAKSAAGFAWTPLVSPAPSGSIAPRVTSLPGDAAVLTWLEPHQDRSSTLAFSVWRGTSWSTPSTIATGQPFSRDQAAAPGIIGLSARTWITYWSQRASTDQDSGNEIALYMAVSSDSGANWTSPVLVNRAAAQPGEDNAYASGVALNEKQAQMVWLDGSNWKTQQRVQLMTRIVTADGQVLESSVLDDDTCTCCSTSIMETSQGLLAAYRGHTPQDIRDISVVRTVAGGWSRPAVPNPDHWHIQACPVNGPHLAAQGERIAMVWFSAPQDQASVQIAFSRNAGADFGPAYRLASGQVVGRAQAVLLEDASALAFWLQNEGGAARLLAQRVTETGSMDVPQELARGLNFGFPHVARTGRGILVTWPERNPTSQVHTGILRRA
jgi:hypothetical protein